MKTFCAFLLICLAGLGYYSYQQHDQLTALQARISELESGSIAESAPASIQPTSDAEQTPVQVAQVPPAAEPLKTKERIIEDFSQIMDNPQMNEMMQASQRATLEVMYKDLLDGLDFSAEERIHFMDLLMARQMFRVETSMKMMGGASSAEEMKLLGGEIKEYDEQVKSAIDTFLNSDEDSNEFEFFEKTIGERMSLSGFKNSMQSAGKPIAPETERSLLQIMADQKSRFPFSSDLADETNYNMGPERFSSENIDKLQTDMQELHNIIAEEAQPLLDPEQLAALAQCLEGMRKMQISQLRMAANMFAPKPKE